MQLKKLCHFFIIICISTAGVSASGGDTSHEPVSPKASTEAKALLKLMYEISGNYTLSGQHNYPNTRDRNSVFAKNYTGKTPVVYSIDMGHARDGDTDSYLARPDIVDESIRQHKKGSLITICWHAVPPTAEEPVTFRQLPDTPADTLKSVQGQLLDKQFEDVLTPGTKLYEQWCKQVDSVVVYLKKLQEAKVPVLWRPYHEMNGDWFWWGGRTGKYSTKQLYVQLFDRLVNHHKINNLVWLWSVDRFHNPEMYYSQYFPGLEYVDVLSLDVYGSDFKKDYYDSLTVLSGGKPLVLGEVGNPPMPEIIDEQPNWGFYATWAGMVRNTQRAQYRMLIDDPRVLFQEDSAYMKLVSTYRKSCKLPLLPIVSNAATNFSGDWIFNEERSTLDNWGSSRASWKISVKHEGEIIKLANTIIQEYAEAKIEEESYRIDGSIHESKFWDLPRLTTLDWSDDQKSLIFESKVEFPNGGEGVAQMKNMQIWTLSEDGSVLSIQISTDSPWGKSESVLVYTKDWYYPPL